MSDSNLPTKEPQSSKLQITVRMYRPGLGDCFLLKLKKGRLSRYILIDCGVLQRTAGERERLNLIIQDIWRTTRGRLHVLVATHEHADHLSGYVFHASLFREKFHIDQVWMPWTENKDDPKVKETYRQYWKITSETLEIAIAELEKKGKQYAHYQELLDFLNPGAMDVVKDWGKKQFYLDPEPDENGPTMVLPLDKFKGVRVHVLGPPKDLEALKRSDPPKSKHQLDRGAAVNLNTTLTSAIFQLGFRAQDHHLPQGLTESDLKELVNLSLPFDRTQGISLDDITLDEDQDFFQKYYGSATHPDDEQSWRRIDTDWLEAIGPLALGLDNDINNTSLVLAFEMQPSQKVLLFCADAQYGSWKSWTGTTKGKDILKRTVFYKVGHHGSHNATQLEGGLLAMNPDDLVAMIPVDIYKAKSKNWKMPAPILVPLLNKQTKGRIITAIEGEAGPASEFTPPNFPKGGNISNADWQKFSGAIASDDSPEHLWVEYTLTE
jgi:beta-lactamase superfamily II metal-dependent hydrolase